MQIDAIILNLDGTLVDSTGLSALRDEGQWQECIANIHTTRCFPYVERVLSRLSEKGVRLGVVTSSVTSYAERAPQTSSYSRACVDRLPRRAATQASSGTGSGLFAAANTWNPRERSELGTQSKIARRIWPPAFRALGAGWNEDLTQDGELACRANDARASSGLHVPLRPIVGIIDTSSQPACATRRVTLLNYPMLDHEAAAS